MSTDKEEKASSQSNRNDVVYSINSYEDTRNTLVSVSYDPTDYIQKARVTRALPPKPAYDPLQFVQLKPCSLVKTAQEQMKKADDVKKIKDEKKEEPEEWQCNLDNWKSSRRKRVEHIIDRVVEVKKLELEEHDRNRRKSKTFNEMMEERSSRRLKYLPIYTDDDNNDLSELGINNDPANLMNSNSGDSCNTTSQESSTEYTYEGAIEDYKSRISRATQSTSDNNQRYESNADQKTIVSKSKNTTKSCNDVRLTTKDDKNMFETLLPEVPKIDFSKRKELFEKEQDQPSESESRRQSSDFVSTLSIKQRLSVLQLNHAQETNESEKYKKTIPDVSFTDLKNRLETFEREIRTFENKEENFKSSSHKSLIETPNSVGQNLNLSSLSPDKTKEGNESLNKPVYLLSSYNEILKQKSSLELDENDNVDTDREDSGIHTTDVSCSVSQADDQNEEVEQLTNDESDVKTVETLLKGQSSSLIEEVTQAEADETNDVNILDDALEMAFQEIDNMESTVPHPITSNTQEPIYQNISEINEILPQNTDVRTIADNEPYYQVPKSQEPYYEVPKTKPIPLYENVDIMQSVNIVSGGDTGTNFTTSLSPLEPPKEKPPPPPVDTKQDFSANNGSENFKRINSTKRIKKELHIKRSSFLGIDTEMTDGDRLFNFPTASPSKTVASFLQEEKHLEKQYLLNAGLNEHSDAAESRDSGVSENHSRQSSDLFTTSSDDPEELIKPKIGENKISKYRTYYNSSMKNDCFLPLDDEFRYQISDTQVLQPEDLPNTIPPPIPPAKPLRSPQYLQNPCNFYKEHSKSLSNVSNLDYGELQSSTLSPSENHIAYHNACNSISTLSNDILPLCDPTHLHNNLNATGNRIDLSNCLLKIKPSNEWEQYRVSHDAKELVPEINPPHNNMLQQRSLTECSPQWNAKTSRMANRSSDSYSRHWFVQEAEQRRIEQQQQAASNSYLSRYSQNKNVNRKSLPESVIQTITQRVQDLGIGSDRRWHPEGPYQANEKGLKSEQFNKQAHLRSPEQEEKILSVSGKKKCSHCNNELGRGAAMVIESLGLLYHIDCFKCCVCHTCLGDGFTGTDVRVRKFKLHCQNCFSSEDGVKFSCV